MSSAVSEGSYEHKCLENFTKNVLSKPQPCFPALLPWYSAGIAYQAAVCISCFCASRVICIAKRKQQ